MLIKTNSLTPNILQVIRDKGTETPFSCAFASGFKDGTYLCRQCGLALFRGQDQFDAGCGWPSFDAGLPAALISELDADGMRTEILCARCAAHLGHVFEYEGFTQKNIRHCVNGLSLDFVEDKEVLDTEEAIFAGGCFWGIEYYFQQLPGVVKTEVGYSGGHKINPNYQSVCNHQTGHYEAVRVVFDISKITYEKITQYFFEIHDPTQADGQGPDVGPQYKSAIFYFNEIQKSIAEHLIKELVKLNYQVVTQLIPVGIFWPAEIDHQKFYDRNGHLPYCHIYQPRFRKSK